MEDYKTYEIDAKGKSCLEVWSIIKSLPDGCKAIISGSARKIHGVRNLIGRKKRYGKKTFACSDLGGEILYVYKLSSRQIDHVRDEIKSPSENKIPIQVPRFTAWIAKEMTPDVKKAFVFDADNSTHRLHAVVAALKKNLVFIIEPQTDSNVIHITKKTIAGIRNATHEGRPTALDGTREDKTIWTPREVERYGYLPNNAIPIRNRLTDEVLLYVVGETLENAAIRHRDLRWANLKGKNLRNADLSFTILIDADLRYADLRGANLRGAGVTKDQLKWAITDNTTRL